MLLQRVLIRLRGAREAAVNRGRHADLALASWISVTAVPSDTPGVRLNEIVIDGNCPEWLMPSGVFEVRQLG